MRSIFFAHLFHNSLHFFKRLLPPIQRWYVRYHLLKGTIMTPEVMNEKLEHCNQLFLPKKATGFHVGLVKDMTSPDFTNYVQDFHYWPKYERFLKNNDISYCFYDIQASTWQTEAKKYNVVIWSICSFPFLLEEAKTKIYFLEKYMNIKCYPTYEEIWGYEDKVRTNYLFDHFNLPAIKTVISHSKTETLTYLKTASFPIISKITAGSSSKGVIKINSHREAERFVHVVFSDKGRKTYWQGLRQKDYVYFQKFIDDAKYDLRIIVVGNKLFGYYRYPKKGDFRASGAGNIVMKALPDEAMRIALKTKELFHSTVLAVDMLFSEKDKQYYIIETSINITIDSGIELMVDGKPGYYEYLNDSFIFKEGKYWLQELALQDFFNKLMK